MYLLELVGEDDALARREAASVCSGVEPLAPGLATADRVERVDQLALTRSAGALVGTTDGSVEDARTLLETVDIGVPPRLSEGSDGRDGAGDDTDHGGRGTVRVRARDIRGSTRVSTARAERELGATLVDSGFAVDLDDPDHELRVLFSGRETDRTHRTDDADALRAARGDAGTAAIAWTVARSRRDFGERDPGERPFFQPGSMSPVLARALVNVAGAGPGARVLDPMCGTGGTLIEAGLVGAEVVGNDVQWKMVRGCAENLAWADVEGAIVRGSATRLPLRSDSFDGAVFDAPYGRQSKIVGDLRELVEHALAETRRVADRTVVVADRRWDDAATAAGWTVEVVYPRRVHRSLTRYVHVLE